MSPLYSLPRPSGTRALPSGLLTLDSRSPYLLQGTAPGTEGIQQAFPATAVDLITALGATGVILPANVLAIYLADTASPLVDSLGLGPNLVGAGANALTGRECVGLPDTSFTSKIGVECASNGAGDTFRAPVGAEAFGNIPAGTIFSALLVYRYSSLASGAPGNGHLIGHGGSNPRWWLTSNGNDLRLHLERPGFAWDIDALGAAPFDGSWHVAAVVIDDATLNAQVFTDISNSALTAYDGVMQDLVGRFAFFWNNSGSGTFSGIAYFAALDVALTSAQRAAFWRAFQAAGLGTDPTYTRAGPLVTRITSTFGNVACYGANQPAIGWNTNAAAGDNPLKTGVVCEDGATFLGLGSDNMPAYVGTNAVVTPADGPSGMRDACRVADTDGVNAGYATSGAAVLAGATNVPFIYSAYVKSGGVGTNAVFQSYYTGDAGGPELFTNWTIAGAVSAVWRPFIGLTHTPVGAAHTAVVTRLIPTDNVGASLGTVDFAEVWGVQNSNVDRLAWRRVATGAGAATATATLSYTNVGNARYNPARGRAVVRVCGYAGGAAQEVLLCLGTNGGAAGTLRLCHLFASLRLDIWDTAGALTLSAIVGAALSAAEHILTVEWNAAAGTASIMEGSAVLASAVVAPWVPEPLAVTPIYVGSDETGANAARCFVELLEIWSF